MKQRRGGLVSVVFSALVSALTKEARGRSRRQQEPRPAADHTQQNFEQTPGRLGPNATRDLPPDEVRRLRPSYDPSPDGNPDPGEVVWTWVPYVENDGRGKDRPVLIIARIDDSTTAGCYLSTKAHRGFVSIGVGAWDPQGRESYLAPNRVLRISDEGMRREGHVLAREQFSAAVEAVSAVHGIGR